MPINLDGPSCDNTPKPAAVPNNGKPPTPAKAPNGVNGGPGQWYGTSGFPGIDGIRSNVPARNGVRGCPGGDAGSIVINASVVMIDPSNFGWFSARGGNGGPGGDASTPGGNGGAGGDGGAGWALGRGGDGGDGGAGGMGAHGGDGGPGGRGGRIEINYAGTVPYLPANVAGGRGGVPGTGGAPGGGGPGGRGGDGPFGQSPGGNPGYSPSRRNDGSFGSTGASGQIWINGYQKV